MIQPSDAPPAISAALAEAEEALGRLDDVLAQLGDGDLHRAHRDGGWTVAQVVSHINLCVLLWQADLARFAADPDLHFLFREEVGHDIVGYPPPTVDLARAQLAATRRTLATAGARTEPAVLAREVEIPDLGTMTVEAWTPLIVGHAAGHAEQALSILRDRGVAAQGL